MSRVPGFLTALFLSLSALANSADLVVSVEAPATTQPGQQLTWTGTVENRGPSPAQDVTVRLTSDFGSCSDPLVIGDLFPNEKRSYTCTKTAPTGYYVLTTFFAATSASIPDPNNENNSARATVIVETPPDLYVFTNSSPIVAPGLPFTVEVAYGNRAQHAAHDTVLTITTPTRFLRVPEFCVAEGNTARCALGTLEPPPIYPSNYSPAPLQVTIEAPDVSAARVPIEYAIDAAELDAAPADDHFTRDAMTYRTFTVTNTNDADGGSIRAAVHSANAECNDTWPCMIAFRIPVAAGQQTIALASALPRLAANTLVVDGTTQTAYFPESSIAIDGAALISESALDFERLCGGGVRGLTISGFPGAAITVSNAPSCSSIFGRIFEKNVLENNGRGIELAVGAVISENTIRHNARSAVFLNVGASVGRNILSDNGASGVFVGANAHGTDIAENTIAGNAQMGIAIASDAQHVSVRRNSISDNGLAGIDWHLDGPGTFAPIAYPYINSVRVENGKTIIEGDAYTGGTFPPTVELFANDSVDASGFGEGQRFIGAVDPQRDRFTLTVDEDLTGKWITGTSMRRVYVGWIRKTPVETNGDTGWGYTTTTSEFSRAMKVQ
jgi:parallel beta helix pectate lyase-like protein/uncharacterized protein DUF11